MRESAQSWREVLLSLKNRGFSAPKLATGDGAMGFRAALEEIFPPRGNSVAGCTNPTMS